MSTQSKDTARTAALGDTVELTYREAVCAALEDEMLSDPRVLLLGEDVANDGGVFKTNVGLAEKFPGRVTNTPICENTFIGAAIGMAVTGLRPVVEIMFSDFLPTAGDALVEELPKFRFMSGGQCSVPVTVRSIGGGTGRFGTQHSATGESWFIGLPGLKVAAGGTPAAAYGLLRAAIRDANPVLCFEHKGLYGRKGPILRGEDGIAELGRASVDREGSDLTIVSTLLMTDRSLQASEQLAQVGIDTEVIDLRSLRPLDHATIEASVSKTGRLLVVEEQVHAGGWGATVISQLAMVGMELHTAPRTLSLSDDFLISYSPPLEDEIIPSVEAIATAAQAIMS
jgi:acetoin:2,6-dichlorophenolindophenol oxidoreductase subunit beta